MKIFGFLLLTTVIFGQMQQQLPALSNPKIRVQNSILTQVNGKTISLMDVKKKMDMLFYQNFPQYAHSDEIRFQYYEASWRKVLTDMIDQELILSDASDKEIKVTDGEIREIVEERFGPNVMQTLDKIGLTYDEAWKMIKNELLVQKMTGWFIYSKALAQVTPQNIREAYRLYVKKNPSYSEWKYRVISIPATTPDIAERVYQFLTESKQPPEEIEFKSFQTEGVTISVSNPFSAQDKDLSDLHRSSLASLSAGSYSKPSLQKTRDGKSIYRIFYLAAKEDHPAPAFENLYPQLQNELQQKAVATESEQYLGKLRRHYGYEVSQVVPDEFHPFSLQ